MLGSFHALMNLLGAIGKLMDGTGLKSILEAVSYTHLDVYKRQILFTALGVTTVSRVVSPLKRHEYISSVSSTVLAKLIQDCRLE